MSNSKLSRWMPKCLRPVKKTRPLVRTSTLNVQSLEVREVPASHVFAGSGLWSDSNNWQAGFKPAANETGAIITVLNNVSSTLDISGMSLDQLNMPAGGTLTLTKAVTINGNSGQVNDNVVIGGNATLAGTPAITILGNSYFSVASAKTLTINNDITGSGGFVEEGSGNIKLQGQGTWQGETNIFSGNLILSSPGNADTTLPNTKLIIGDGVGNNLSASVTLGASFEIPDTAPVVIRKDGFMNFAGFTEDYGDLELNGGNMFLNGGKWNVKGDIHATGDANVVVNSANSTMNLGSFTPTVTVDAGKTLTINTAITGTGGIIKEGSGTLTYTTDSTLPSVANTYTGNTTVNNGTLILDNDALNGAMAGNLVIGAANGPSLVQLLQSTELPDDKSVVLLANGTLDVNSKVDIVGAVIIAGGIITTGIGQLTLNGDLTASASNVTSKISGNLNLGAADRTFTVVDGTAAVDLQIDGTLKRNANNLIIDGDGTMVLQNGSASTYTGNTSVNDGTLILGNALTGNSSSAIPTPTGPSYNSLRPTCSPTSKPLSSWAMAN